MYTIDFLVLSIYFRTCAIKNVKLDQEFVFNTKRHELCQSQINEVIV